MNLMLENGEDPETLFLESDSLPEEVQRHRETTSVGTYMDTIIRAIPTSYSDESSWFTETTVSPSNRFNRIWKESIAPPSKM